MPHRWRDSICADGAHNREQGYPHWFSLLERFYFCNVWAAILQYVCANAILFVAEGVQSQQGMSGCYRDQAVHTMLRSVWTWQHSDVMAGRTTALCVCKGVTRSGQWPASRPLFCWFRLWPGQRAILVATETQTVSRRLRSNTWAIQLVQSLEKFYTQQYFKVNKTKKSLFWTFMFLIIIDY